MQVNRELFVFNFPAERMLCKKKALHNYSYESWWWTGSVIKRFFNYGIFIIRNCTKETQLTCDNSLFILDMNNASKE